MGKRREKDKDELEESSKKKSKKHKKHKKKKTRYSISDNEDIDVINDDTGTSQDEGKSFKLKIKFGGRTLSTTEVISDNLGLEEAEKEVDLGVSNFSSEEKLLEKQPQRAAQNEEDEWLDALEKGELDDAGRLKKQKDTSLMTVRQRALCGEQKDNENSLMQLPMYPERTEEENEEFERKRQVRAKKRRQQMQKQIEETKTQTIEKLLTKGQKIKKEGTKTPKDYAHLRYTNNASGITISYTKELDYPLKVKICAKQPPRVQKCGVDGCTNPKKYSCSKTNLPVCSLQCYKTLNKHDATISLQSVKFRMSRCFEFE